MAENLMTKVWALDFTGHRWGDGEEEGRFTTPNVKYVALAIARASFTNGACWASQSTLAATTGLSTKTVGRCIQELEAAEWLKLLSRRRKDGSRSTNKIWLTLPEVVLSADTVSAKPWKFYPGEDVSDDDDDADTASKQGDSMGGNKPTGSPGGGVNESGPSLKGNLKGKNREAEGGLSPAARGDEPTAEEIGLAVASIWQAASKRGRERSSQNDIAAGLRAALKRGHPMEKIMRGLGGYFRTEDATKDDGAFQRGAHVILAKDRFLSFLDDEAARPLGLTPDDDSKVTRFGTPEAPTPEAQRMWMTLWNQGNLWDRDIRGPAPGENGCRVDPAIQREFDADPFAYRETTDEADGDDAAAFD